jgi:hypothetical protein
MHVELDLHCVRECVAVGDVHVLHVSTTSQIADIFTKGPPYVGVLGVLVQSQHLLWLEFRLRGC